MSSPLPKKPSVSFEHLNILKCRFSPGVGALVNSGNKDLAMGFSSGGISAAFHDDVGANRGGESLLKEALINQNRTLGTEVPEGSCAIVEIGDGHNKLKITDSRSLIRASRAKFIIHAVGPNCQTGPYKTDSKKRAKALRTAYEAVFIAAISKGVKEIALPALSIGLFEFPEGEAAKIIAKVMYDYKDNFSSIRLCAFDPNSPTVPTILGLVRTEFDILERGTSSAVNSGSTAKTPAAAIAAGAIDVSFSIPAVSSAVSGKAKTKTRDLIPPYAVSAAAPTELSTKSSKILAKLQATLTEARLAKSSSSAGAGSSSTALQKFFSEEGGRHFDWWAFPLNSYAANDKPGKYRVGDHEITELLQNAEFVTSYRGFITLYFESMGWDIANSRPNGITIPTKLHDVRFAKCLGSMNLFGQQDFRNSADVFLTHSRPTRKAPLFENGGHAWALEDCDATIARAVRDPGRYPDRHRDSSGATIVDGFAEFKRMAATIASAGARAGAGIPLSGGGGDMGSGVAAPMPRIPGFADDDFEEEAPTLRRPPVHHAAATSDEEASTRRTMVLAAYNSARKDGQRLANEGDVQQLIAGVALIETNNLSSHPYLDRIYFHENDPRQTGKSFFENHIEVNNFHVFLKNLGILPEQPAAVASPVAKATSTSLASAAPTTVARPQPSLDRDEGCVDAIRIAGLSAYKATTRRNLSGDKATALIDALLYLAAPTASPSADGFVDAAAREKLFKNKAEFGKFLTNLSGCGLEISEPEKLVVSYERRTNAGARVAPLDADLPSGSFAASGAVTAKSSKGPQHWPS